MPATTVSSVIAIISVTYNHPTAAMCIECQSQNDNNEGS